MNIIAARYFDGKRSVKHGVSLLLAGGRVKVIGRNAMADYSARRVRVSPRIADTPRWIYLPDGATCAVEDSDAIDRLVREGRFARIVRAWERRPIYAVVSVMLVAALAWLFVDRGVPSIAESIAHRIPPATESALGAETLASMDKYLLQPSRLEPARREALIGRFRELVRAAGETTAYRVEFRSGEAVGPNAFALPSGIIVMTDQLVALAQSDDEVLAVLAHELGHVKHRHAMRRILESSLTGLVIGGLTGDISSMSSLAAGAPFVMVQLAYSRANEREADRHAAELLRASGVGAHHLGELLKRIEAKYADSPRAPAFLSTHPRTEERGR